MNCDTRFDNSQLDKNNKFCSFHFVWFMGQEPFAEYLMHGDLVETE